MADEIQRFRSSIGGFNREDVVAFIQSLSAQHQLELSALREENRRQAADSEALRQELTQVKAELAEAKAALTQATAPVQEVQTPPDYKSEELAAYRRAEEVERQSRERAAEQHRKLTALVADASVQMDEAAASLSQVMVQLNTDILQLRESMDDGKSVLNQTAQALRASGAQE